MLWPDDTQRREQVVRACLLHIELTTNVATPGYELRNKIHELEALPTQSDIIKWMKKRYEKGLKAGSILMEAIGHVALGSNKGKLTSIKAALGDGKRTIENDWKEFRKVSHLWAAYRYLMDAEAAVHTFHTPMSFPVNSDYLDLFLSFADQFKTLAYDHHRRGSPRKSLVEQGELTIVHTLAHLPAVNLNFMFSTGDIPHSHRG